jgi:acetolactate synthase-1/2/3 large subunit
VNGAESLIHTALRAGVEVCFANPGTTEMPLVAALDSVPGVRAVLGLFEGVCTGAADGYGRMTGRPALTLLHLGPGFANGIANLHNARRARSPIVNLVGDQARWHLEHDAPLTSDIESLARPVSGWVRSARSAGNLASDLAEAIAAAQGPPGCVATLIAPADCQWEDSQGPATPIAATPAPRLDAETIDRAAGRLRDATRPALLLGGAALGEAGLDAAARVAAASGARLICETFPARVERGGARPRVERLPYFPEQARETLSSVDVLALCGAKDPVSFFGYPGQASGLAASGSALPFAAPEHDVVAALVDLADALDAPARAPSPATAPTPACPSGSGPITPDALGAALVAVQPEDAIVMDEAATSGLPYFLAAAGAAPHSYLALTGGAIGQGLPCATGAAIACPDRKVIAFQADGSGAYTLQALWTQAREGLDVTTVICANRAYRILQVELARAGVAEPGPAARSMVNLTSPPLDWVDLARGLGVPGERVETCEALLPALDRAIGEPGPRLVEVLL